MAKIDLSKIAEPISDEQPCGPDLDMEFDADFMNFIAEIEGDLPTSYFKFEPGGFKFDSYYDRIGDLLAKTRDVRLLVPLAKLRILQGDIGGFAEAVDALYKLLKARWADVHPQPMDGDYALRTGYLFTLDDNPNCVLPLQHAGIVRSRRHGPITLRRWQVASGEVNPREGEDMLDASTLMSALAEADAAEIEKVRGQLQTLRDAIAGIQKVVIEEAGYDNAVSLERLPGSVSAMLEMIAAATGAAEAEGAAAGEEGAEGGPGRVLHSVVLPPGAVTSRAQVKEALHVAARYFALNEPSNPAQVLLREAEAAVDKGFYALVYELMPAQAPNSVVRLGTEPYFELSLTEMDSRNPAPDYASEVGEPASSSWEDTGLGEDDSVSGDAGNEDAAVDEAADAGDTGTADEAAVEEEAAAEEPTTDEPAAEEETAEAEAEEAPADDSWTNEAVAEAEDATQEDAESEGDGPKFWANSRPEAVALMEKVIAYYKVAEPTSPIPLLLERAIDMASKSFIDLLRSILPDGALQTTRTEE